MSENHDQRPQLDAERMALARARARENRRLIPLDLGLSAGYFVLWWLLVHEPLIRWLDTTLASFTPRLLVYVGLFGLGAVVVDLPLEAYRYRRAVHYGLSVQSWREWFVDVLKGLVVGAILGGILVLVLYYFLQHYPATWWLWMGLVYLLFTVILAQLAPVLIMPLFLKFTPYEEDELSARLRSLAGEAGTQVRGVFRTNLSSKTTAANAWLSGLGRTRRIVLGDTLLEHYTPDEIVSVFAHELGHHVHRDIWHSIVLATLVNLAGFAVAGVLMRWAVGRYGFAGPGDLRAFPWLVVSLALFAFLTSPLLNAYSRGREWAADRYAYRHGPGARAFADALTRLTNQNLADPEPPRWQVFLFYSHPPALERIQSANQFAVSQSRTR
ncbi:MAG: M48 family peptidase [Caldilineae bacterium]|nr:MAG: M48 family peptidase [Caldilineae bacterium]